MHTTLNLSTATEDAISAYLADPAAGRTSLVFADENGTPYTMNWFQGFSSVKELDPND